MADGALGPSLFSRAGKSSTQRIQVLKNSASILRVQAVKKYVPTLPVLHSLKKEERPKDELDELIVRELQVIREESKLKEDELETKEKHAKTSPFLAPGRENLEGATSSLRTREKAPPCGHYNVSYSQMDKHALIPSLHRSRSPPPAGDQSLPPGYYEPVPVTRSIPSPVPMRLQSDRKLAVGLLDAHEKRFEQMALMPGIASKYRRCGALDMAKSLPRAGLMVSVSSPQYDVNKETIMTSLGHTFSFSKMTPRRPLFKLIPEQVEPYDVLYSQVLPKSMSKDFASMPPRDHNPDLPLPSFMQDSTSRFAIEMLNEKMMKMNCNRDSLLSPKLSNAEKLRLLHSVRRSPSLDYI